MQSLQFPTLTEELSVETSTGLETCTGLTVDWARVTAFHTRTWLLSSFSFSCCPGRSGLMAEQFRLLAN